MEQKNKTQVQIFIVLILSVAGLALLALILESVGPAAVVSAQDSVTYKPCISAVDASSLAAMGLTEEEVQAAAANYDLEIDINPSTWPSLSGASTVQYQVLIKNLSAISASYVLFCDDVPDYMNVLRYEFDNTEVISDGLASPTWLIPTIPATGTEIITVTTWVDSSCDRTLRYVAYASPFDANADYLTLNNVDYLDVTFSGLGACSYTLYLPQVRKDPTPTPIPILYSDDFSNDDSGWPEIAASDCETEYSGGWYVVRVDADDSCFAFAPNEAEYTYAEFEVEAQRIGGHDKYAYGIYFNGEGGGEYYLFRIWPDDDCGWQLRRREDDIGDIKIQGGCVSAIKRGDNDINVLRAIHTSDGKISVYVNDVWLGTYIDTNQLTGNGTGVYVHADDTQDIDVRFDDFTVYNP